MPVSQIIRITLFVLLTLLAIPIAHLYNVNASAEYTLLVAAWICSLLVLIGY